MKLDMSDPALVHAWAVARDDSEVVAAFERLHLIRTHNWPMVAVWLLDSGFDGSALVSMAALDSHADAWDVDPRRAEVLREVAAPAVDDDRAALLVGATLAEAKDPLAETTGCSVCLPRLLPASITPMG